MGGLRRGQWLLEMKTRNSECCYYLIYYRVLSRYGRVVNYLIDRTKDAVGNRERTKKSLALAVHQFRLAFLQLGNLLAQDAMIPSANLVFFYTMSELKQIVESGSTKSVLHK